MKKKTILALSSAVVVGLLAVSLVSVTALEWAKAEGNATSCAKIEFGTTTNNNASELGTDTSKFSVSGMTINSISSTKVYCSTLGEAAKLGSSSAGGSLTVTFDSLLITSIRLFAFEYSTSEGTAGITVQTSALAAAQDGSVSNSAAPDLTALSGTGIYLFSGLDGGTGTSSTSLTIASPSKRFYLSKIRLTINGSSAPASSSSAASFSGASLSSSVASAFPVLSSYDYRIAPNYSASASTMPIYNVALISGSYKAQTATAITKTTDCLNAEQVAEYYVSFRTLPPNYFPSTSQAINYGKNGRVVSTYTSGGTHTYDYTVKLGTWNVTSGGTYYEFDIDLTGSYNTGSSISRGSGRVVAIVDGITDYGSDPVCYYTEDHYADFKEYYNFYKGWSPLFAGVYNKSGTYENSPKTTLSRPSVPTVSYTLA